MTDENNIVEGTGERLRAVADALYDGNKSALARALDMQPGSFSKYLRETRKPGASVLGRLVRLGVNLNWLLDGEGPMLVDGSAAEADGQEADPAQMSFTVDGVTFYRVPIVRVRVDGDGSLQLDERGRGEWLSRTHIRRQYGADPGRIRAFSIPCNRMAPMIRTGDRVRAHLVERLPSVEALTDDAPYLLFGPTGVLVMRVCTTGGDDDGGVVLRADNPEVDDVCVSARQWGDTYRPIARVLEVIRPL
jgi:hypothetical protein